MTKTTLFSALLGSVIVLSFAIGMHSIGQRVARQDAKQFAEHDQMIERAAAAACGRRAEVIKTRHGWLCLYVNPDGESITRPVLDSPIAGVM